MLKKILKLSLINTFSAGFNFLSTILIVKSFGLSILGEFTVFNALIALFLLIYIVLPPNYSIFKLQDENTYIQYFNYNYFFISFLLIPIVFFIDKLNLINIDGLLLYFYIAFLALQNYFDVFFQASNQLYKYFIALFVISLIRLIALLYVYFSSEPDFSLELLIEIYFLPLLFVNLVLIFIHRNTIIKRPFISIEQYLGYLKKYFTVLRSYYLGAVIKRLKDNSLVLLFSMVVSSEIIGLYSLFIKVGSFVLGQVRVFEAFLMNRSNLAMMDSLKETPLFVGFFVQMILIAVGLVYLKINTGSFNFISLLLYSFIAYPYLQIILSRSKLLSKYNNTAINQSYLFYILLIGISFVIANIMKIESLNYILVTVLLGDILISQTLSSKLGNKMFRREKKEKV